jgi:hypothetical protein
MADKVFKPDIRNVSVVRYLAPLREGGSLPAIAEADDGFKYVLKFRGAGQGPKALIAELIGGEIARCLGLKVPEIVFATLDSVFGQSEPDEEIQDLLKASTGLNLGMHYLQGSITYDPAVNKLEPWLASQIVWLDCLILNVDRTARNTNMLMWNKELWLIDFGASLYFHHAWSDWKVKANQPFNLVKEHVLLPQASMLDEVDSKFKTLLTPEILFNIIDVLPNAWLQTDSPFDDPERQKEAYIEFLVNRVKNSSVFINAAENERESII